MNHKCTIDGCSKAVRTRGWCAAHYKRWQRHGDALGGRTPDSEPLAFLENVVLSFDGNECLIWPYAKNLEGYGRIKRDGKTCLVTRIVCEHEHGPPPTPKHHAAHLCGKGNLGCVNRKHLAWKTPKENNADKLLHGTAQRGGRNGFAKLTESQVLLIRSSAKLQRELAEEYGLSPGAISNIKLRKRWSWLEASA